MNRPRILLLSILSAVVFFSSCSDERSPIAPDGDPGPSLSILEDAATERVSLLIEALYPKPGLYRQAANRWRQLQRLVDRGQIEDAQDIARGMANQAIILVRQGHLLDPTDFGDPTLPETTEEVVGEMVTRLYVYSGLEAQEAQEENPEYFEEVLGEEDSGVGIIDPESEDPTTVVTQNEWAAVVVEPGTADEPTYVTVNLLDEETCTETGDLVTALGCWNIESFPEIEGDVEDEPMRIEICVADPDEILTEEEWDLLLVHEKDQETGEITALPYVEPEYIDCEGFDPSAPPPAPASEAGGPVASALRSFGNGIADLLLPAPLAAVPPFRARPPRGIGGLRTDFSEFFGAVSEADAISEGTGAAATWDLTAPSGEVVVCGEADSGDCPGPAVPWVDVSAVASGLSIELPLPPWDRVYFYFQPQDGSAPPTMIGDGPAGDPETDEIGGTNYFEWTVRLEGPELPVGRLEIFALGAVDEGETYSGTYRTGFNTNVSVYAEVEPLQTISTLGAGNQYTCALRSDGKAFCWGRNYYGQLGDGTRTFSPTPVEVRGGHTFDQLYVTDRTACGLTSAGSAYCWGYNRNGMLGAGQPITTEDNFSLEPVPVSGGHTFTQLDMSYSNVCGIASDGTTYCWGRNRYAELGNGFQGSEYDSNVPVPVNNSGALGLVTVSGPYRHGCGLTGTGDAYCWGLERYFGNGEIQGNTYALTPTPAVSGMRLSVIDVGTGYTCGIDGNQDTYCWGHYAEVGSLGNGTEETLWDPTLVAGGHSFVSVRANDTNTSIGSTCALTAGGEAWCWGANHYGQLGGPSSDFCSRIDGEDCALSPIPVSGGISFSSIDVGRYHTCGLDQGGTLYCWGDNGYGELGDGTLNGSPVPVVVGDLVVAPGAGPIVVTPFREALSLIGETLQLSAEAQYGNGYPVDPQPTLTWSTSDPAVATVDQTGLVTAVSDGSAVIRVSAPDGATGRATVSVSITDPVGAFNRAFNSGSTDGMIVLSGLLADEWINSGSFLSHQEVDRRSIPLDASWLSGAFSRLGTAREVLEWDAARLQSSDPGNPQIGDLLTRAGFVYLAYAQNWCTGVPLDDPNVGLSTAALLNLAITRFSDAILASISSDFRTAARLGRARAYRELGDYTNAVADAAMVPTDFSWNLPNTTASGEENTVFLFSRESLRISVPDVEGGNGLPFLAAADPRVPWDGGTSIGTDGVTLHYGQLKYLTDDSPTPLATGVEARLIQAEASLDQTTPDVTGFLDFLNQARVFLELSELEEAPTIQTERINLLYSERAFSLYATGQRLGDLRRLVSTYARPATAVFPVGPYHLSGNYGIDLNLPVPASARGPSFTGCPAGGS